MPQSFMLCPSCGTHRLMNSAKTCPSCEDASSALMHGRSKVIAAALGISLSIGVSVTACKPSPQATHYGGAPIELDKPVAEESAGDQGVDAKKDAPDMAPDMMANVPLKGSPPVDIYGGPPIDIDDNSPADDPTTTKKESP